MKHQRTINIVIGAILVVLSIWFYPQYQKQVPVTGQAALKVAVAEVSQIPQEAPLQLITQPDDTMSQLKDAIDGAQKTVDLVIYELDDPIIEQSLVNAKNRGILVRVILQNINTFGRHPNQSAYDFLKNQAVPIIWAQPYFALTHQKTLMVDNAEAFIMTFNLVDKYYATSRDFGLIDRDPTDIDAIESAFESDWRGTQEVAGNGADLVWSPGSAQTLLAFINSATATLDIYSLEMDDARITAAIEAAAARGVAVRLNMTYGTSWKKVLGELVVAGVSVRTYPSTAKFFIHAKVMVADGVRAFVGSENFSMPSLDLNRELGILLSRPDIISALQKTFDKDWLGSRPFVVK